MDVYVHMSGFLGSVACVKHRTKREKEAVEKRNHVVFFFFYYMVSRKALIGRAVETRLNRLWAVQPKGARLNSPTLREPQDEHEDGTRRAYRPRAGDPPMILLGRAQSARKRARSPPVTSEFGWDW